MIIYLVCAGYDDNDWFIVKAFRSKKKAYECIDNHRYEYEWINVETIIAE